MAAIGSPAPGYRPWNVMRVIPMRTGIEMNRRRMMYLVMSCDGSCTSSPDGRVVVVRRGGRGQGLYTRQSLRS